VNAFASAITPLTLVCLAGCERQEKTTQESTPSTVVVAAATAQVVFPEIYGFYLRSGNEFVRFDTDKDLRSQYNRPTDTSISESCPITPRGLTAKDRMVHATLKSSSAQAKNPVRNEQRPPRRGLPENQSPYRPQVTTPLPPA